MKVSLPGLSFRQSLESAMKDENRKTTRLRELDHSAGPELREEETGALVPSNLCACRECAGTVSEQAQACPHCGAPQPAKPEWDGYGYEYKSRTTVFGIPLVHVSFKYRPNRQPVVAKGIISIGQFGVGIVNVSQFGIGVFSVGQFTAAAYAVAQFGFASKLVAQFGVYVTDGLGQLVWRLSDLLAFL
jgi:hypothetical protein